MRRQSVKTTSFSAGRGRGRKLHVRDDNTQSIKDCFARPLAAPTRRRNGVTVVSAPSDPTTEAYRLKKVMESIKPVEASHPIFLLGGCLLGIAHFLSDEDWTRLLLQAPTPVEKVARHVSPTVERYQHHRRLKDLSESQRAAYEAAVLRRENLFISGSAGTGKSFVLKAIVEGLRMLKLKVEVTATTGSAALELNLGASTLHSFARIGLGDKPVDDYLSNRKRLRQLTRAWGDKDVLIIEEVSMLDADFLSKLATVSRYVRQFSPDLPPKKATFGGLQIIFCGDFCQLPPVHDRNSTPTFEFCFESPTWCNSVERTVLLQQVFRQKDAEFIALLNAARFGRLNGEQVQFLKNLVMVSNCGVPSALGRKNYTRLRSTREEVKQINNQEMEKLTSPPMIYKMDSGLVPGTEQDDEERFGTLQEKLDGIAKSSPAEPELTLKMGCLVVLTVNLDVKNGLVNGSQGEVVGFREVTESPNLHSRLGQHRERLKARGQWKPKKELVPLVRFIKTDQTLAISRYVWETEIPSFGLAYQEQLPLLLSSALTFHRAQGMSLDAAEMKLDRIFSFGMAYTALSRVRTIEGLRIISFDEKSIRAHPKVVRFYEQLNE